MVAKLASVRTGKNARKINVWSRETGEGSAVSSRVSLLILHTQTEPGALTHGHHPSIFPLLATASVVYTVHKKKAEERTNASALIELKSFFILALESSPNIDESWDHCQVLYLLCMHRKFSNGQWGKDVWCVGAFV